MFKQLVRARLGWLAALLVLGLAACETVEAPTAPELAPTVVFGRIAAAPGTTGPASTTTPVLSNIVVSTDDGSVTTVTDDHGSFRLEVRAKDGRVRVRFRRGSLDLRLELSGLPEGGVYQLDLSLGEDDLTVLSASDSDEADFDGIVTAMEVTGDAPSRTAVVQVEDDDEAFVVQVVEGETHFDQDEDILSFEAMVEAVLAGPVLEVDGDGSLQMDGSIVAHEIEVEVEEHDDDSHDDDPHDDDSHDDDSDDDDSNDDDSDDDGDDDGSNDAGDFDGSASLVAVTGDAPDRTTRITVTNLTGTTTIDVVEGVTTFDPLGDAVTFDAMLMALMTEGLAVEIEGDGAVQADGTVVATSVKVETDS